MNMFPNTHFIPTDDIIKYVKSIVSYHTVLKEYVDIGLGEDWYMEYTYLVVPKHFYFIIIADDSYDEMYRFGFLNNKNQILKHSEDESFHHNIENICIFKSKSVIAKDQKRTMLPSTLKSIPWTPGDIEMIERRINSVVSQRNLKLENQR